MTAEPDERDQRKKRLARLAEYLGLREIWIKVVAGILITLIVGAFGWIGSLILKSCNHHEPALVIADFANCSGVNNLGGKMEPCFGTPNYLIEKYMPSDQDETGCMARLEYIVKSDWTGFCLQLQGADLGKYSKITFDIRADDPVPAMMKIDLRRDNGQEVSSAKVSGITQQWKTMSVDLSAFQAVGWASPLSSLTNLEELALVFEEGRSGESGVVYIDNIQAVP